MEDKKEFGQFYYFIFGVCLLLFFLVVVGFVVFANRKEEIIENEENGGNVVLNYSSNMPGLHLEKIVPTTDVVAKSNLKEGEFFDFSVSTSLDSATEINYEIVLVNNKQTTVKSDDLVVYLENEKNGAYIPVFEPKSLSALKKETDFDSPDGSMVLYNMKKTKSEDDKYRLRVWLSDKSLAESGNVDVEIQVYGKAK